MVRHAYSLESDSLEELLTKAKKLLLKNGIATASQRGLAYSLNNVFLTWVNPGKDKTRYSFWDKVSDEWYQDNFVRKNKKNIPEKISAKNNLLIPYRYAQRARYNDAGWGYGLALVKANKLVATSFEESLATKKAFTDWLIDVSQYLHLQTVLEVLMWWGKRSTFWLSNENLVGDMVKQTRVDMLERIVDEIVQTPNTRRAITDSFMYTLDYQLNPMMGVPPYQNFQLLPAEKNEPLASLHWHRSLDASGGAQLDFNHDFDWLSYACQKSNRKIGNISIIAGNLHLYASSESDAKRNVNPNNDIHIWLNKVTDGYMSKSMIQKELVEKDNYKSNINLVYKRLKKQ